MTVMIRLSAAVLAAALLVSPATAESPVVGAMQEYMEFSTYEAGIILPQQLSKDVFESVVFIDTRDAGQFGQGYDPRRSQYRMARGSESYQRHPE